MPLPIVKVKVHRAAIRQLLKDGAWDGILAGHARGMVSRAGPGHDYDLFVGRVRVRATVYTATPEAMRSEADNRTLSKAIG